MRRLVIASILAVVAGVTAWVATGMPVPQQLRFGVEAVAGDTVMLGVHHGACDSGPRVRVKESAERVELRVSTYVTSGPCQAVGYYTRVEVRLDEPLGMRELVDSGGRVLVGPD